MPDPTAILSREELLKVQFEYEAGTFKSLTELASRYGLSVQTLHARIKREKWDVKRNNILLKTEKNFEKIKVNESQAWLKRVKERSVKDWEIIDRSIDNVGSEVDPDMMLTSTRARKLIDDMYRRSSGLVDPSLTLDITSKGQSLGDSLLSAIAKIRQDSSAPKVTSAQVDRLLECEIVDDHLESGTP